MKKIRLLLGLLLLLTSATLVGCDYTPESSNVDPKVVDNGGNTKTPEATKYTVTFDTDGGSYVSSQEVKEGEKATKPTDPTKEGYTFGGWYYSTFYFLEYNFSSKVTGDLTLYAKWNEIPKTVSYEVGTPTIDFWTNSINTKWMKVAIPVTNTGEANIYLGSGSFDIETSSGTLLATKSYISVFPNYLKPGETGYYYEETTCDFNETNVRVVPNVEVEKAKNDVVRYDVSDVSIIADKYDGVKVMGRVQNNTTEKGSTVYVVANLFDSTGNLICNCFTILNNDLNAGSKVGFTMTPFAYDKLTPEDVTSYEVYAYPYQYNW